jgi:hypothetical protein
VWAAERVWAADQKITQNGDIAVIEFTSSQLSNVLDWVLSRGATARPVEPRELVDLWEQHIRDMAEIVKTGRLV